MPTIIGCTLPDPYYSKIQSVREELVDTFGVDEYANPFPHFTLYPLNEEVDIPSVVTAIKGVTENQEPFSVHTDGIGVFPPISFGFPSRSPPSSPIFIVRFQRRSRILGHLHSPIMNRIAGFPTSASRSVKITSKPLK